MSEKHATLVRMEFGLGWNDLVGAKAYALDTHWMRTVSIYDFHSAA